MGVNLLAYEKSAHMSYSGFHAFRVKLAGIVMGDKGELYDTLLNLNMQCKKDFELAEQLEKELEKYGKAFHDFMLACDCEGRLSVKKCKELYKLLENKQADFSMSYPGELIPNYLNEFRDLLKDCVEHNKPLTWN